jgi:hypothetical protein
MHVELTEENKDKLLKASNQLDLSVSSIVNGLVATVDCIAIEYEIRVSLKALKSKKSSEALRFRTRTTTIF